MNGLKLNVKQVGHLRMCMDLFLFSAELLRTTWPFDEAYLCEHR